MTCGSAALNLAIEAIALTKKGKSSQDQQAGQVKDRQASHDTAEACLSIPAIAERAAMASSMAVRDAVSLGRMPDFRLSLAAALEQIVADGCTQDMIPLIVTELRRSDLERVAETGFSGLTSARSFS